MLDYWFLGAPVSWLLWGLFWSSVLAVWVKREPILTWLDKVLGS